MQTRRAFLSNSTSFLFLLGGAMRSGGALRQVPLGVQLYTVRELAGRDLGTLFQRIKQIGYAEVETFEDLYTRSARDLRRAAGSAGLRIPSGHFAYETFEQMFDYAKNLGVDWMVCPELPKSLAQTEDGFHAAARNFNVWGRRLKDLGMRFAFHNHNRDFRPFGMRTGYDILVEETDPDLVFFEVDCYWIVQAGQNLLQTLQALGKRIRMLHLKDRKPGFPNSLDSSAGHFTEVGHGTIDWRAVLEQAQRIEIEHYFVEQDQTPGDPIESIRSSYTYLQNLI